MNFLKKKLKPITSGLSSNQNKNNKQQQEQDLESDLYDDYVVEAPPHPSELLALGVDPIDIDVNDPEKLRELYRKVKEEGKEKKVNSVLLAKQRQKEEIEAKKKTAEEWKFFDSLTARCEEAVKSSQKKLEQLKETSAIDTLTEPEYEFKDHSPPKPAQAATPKLDEETKKGLVEGDLLNLDEQNSFGFPIARAQSTSVATVDSKSLGAQGTQKKEDNSGQDHQQHIVEELFEDLGIDLRPSDQRAKSPITPTREHATNKSPEGDKSRSAQAAEKNQVEEDPFDTSFIDSVLEKPEKIEETLESRLEAKFSNVDPFDTSFVDL